MAFHSQGGGETPAATGPHHHTRPLRRPPPRDPPPPPLRPFPRPRRPRLLRLPAAVRSSPAFRRRFRALHPPPLLGFFFDTNGAESPSFTALRRRSDPDLAVAVRGADIFLTRVPSHDDGFPGWEILECHGGYLLLHNCRINQIAAYNPLTQALDLLPAPPDKISNGHHGKFIPMDCFLLSSGDEVPYRSWFRVVFLCHDKSRLRAAVFSSATREWQILLWWGPAPEQPASGKYWLLKGRQLNGLVCWSHARHAYMVVLDAATLQFSCIDLPVEVKGQGHLYMVGDTKDGKLCVVAAIEFTLFVWFRRADAADGVEKWMFDNMIPLEGEVLWATKGSRDDHGELKVFAILDGIVYLKTFETFRDPSVPCWYLCFSLETRKLEKLFFTKTGGHPHPYFMAWPTSFVGNNLSP